MTAAKASIDEQVLREQVGLSFLQTTTATSGNILVALALMALADGAALPWFSLAPFAAVLVVQTLRFVQLFRYRRAPDARTPAQWRTLIERTSLAGGIAWGSSGPLTYAFAPIELQMILMIVAAGLCSAALATLGPLRTAYLSYLLPFFAGLTPVTAIYFPRFALVLAGLLAFYAVVMARTSRTQADAIGRSLRLFIENQSLVADLRAASLRAEEARDRAESANQAKGQFLARMSHELRTPLNGILGVHELLLSAQLPAEERRFVATAHQAGTSLLSIINDVLDFSKMEADRVELSVAPFRLERLFEELMSLFAIAAQRKGLRLSHRLDPAISSMVVGDELRLRQVLTNLLGNAIKFTSRGEVSLDAQRDADGRVRFTVKDTGIGVKADQQALIFDSFEQGDGSISRRFGGTGLGLAISRRLVELMGGGIEVRSQPGEGSAFFFSVALPSPRDVADEPAPAPVGRGRTAVVSLAHARSAENVARWLGALGFEVFEGGVDAGGPLPALLVIDAARAAEAPAGVPVMLCEESISVAHQDEAYGRAIARVSHPLLRSSVAAAVDDLLEPRAASGVRQTVASWSSARVLVVDDDAINRTIAQAMLGRLGCEPRVLSGGAEALEAMAKEQFDLVLMDCEMPDVDGLTATREHRRREREGEGARLPVVALTAHATEVQRTLCLAAEMDEMMTKPLSLTALQACLSKWCAAPATRAGQASP
ncbi:MAG: response regulator [Myxococcus sp.]|nr:response regulator [Myxococcus sp.]